MTSEHVDDVASSCITRFSDIAGEPQEMLMPIEGYENKPLVTLEEAVVPLIPIIHDVKRKALEMRDFSRTQILTSVVFHGCARVRRSMHEKSGTWHHTCISIK